MKILITGGAGFIGSALVGHLLSAGAEVFVVDKLTYAANPATLDPFRASPRFRFAQIDICDVQVFREALLAFAPDHVAHLAAETHVDRSITGSRTFIDTNILGTHSVLEAVRAYLAGRGKNKRETFRILHVSTDEVFGSLGPEGAFSETTKYDPSSPYSASKAAADHLVLAWHRTYGVPAIISNCSNNYGPRQFPEKLIPRALLNALEGKPVEVYGDGLQVRDWLHVADHARALVMMLEKGVAGETYCVGGRAEKRNIDVVTALCALLDTRRPRPDGRQHSSLITHVRDRPGHDRRYAIDAAKISRDLGWQPQESFDSGLGRTVDWYLANPDWWQPLRRGVYAGERLGIAASGD